jgi:hypothetical protein
MIRTPVHRDRPRRRSLTGQWMEALLRSVTELRPPCVRSTRLLHDALRCTAPAPSMPTTRCLKLRGRCRRHEHADAPLRVDSAMRENGSAHATWRCAQEIVAQPPGSSMSSSRRRSKVDTMVVSSSLESRPVVTQAGMSTRMFGPSGKGLLDGLECARSECARVVRRRRSRSVVPGRRRRCSEMNLLQECGPTSAQSRGRVAWGQTLFVCPLRRRVVAPGGAFRDAQACDCPARSGLPHSMTQMGRGCGEIAYSE